VTLADADHRTTIDPAHELATLTALQAIVRSPDTGSAAFARSPGVAWDTARDLAPMLLSGRYVALVYDAEPDERTARSPQRFDALGALGRALNERTRCAAIALRGGGNRSGADSVLTSQTGYPMAVDFARGRPRYGPHDGLGAVAPDDDRSDVALVVGNAAALPPAISSALSGIHTITIGPRASESPLGNPAVTIDTGVDGIHAGGTAFRTDDVPLPLRAVMAGLPSAVDTVRSIASLVRRMAR
jgi:formylmethanofuran dehydrogenase subunit B